MQGWIKLHRSMLQWEWYSDMNTKAVFIHCLLKANHKSVNWRGELIERGSFITSLDTMVNELGISKQQIRTALKKLEKTSEINTRSNTRFTLITICNYDIYQQIEENINTPINTPVTHQQHTDNTKQELKNNKNKKEPVIVSTPEMRFQAFRLKVLSFRGKYSDEMLKDFFEYWTEKNETGKKYRFEMEKVFDVSRRLSTWNKNEFKNKTNGTRKNTGATDAEFFGVICKHFATDYNGGQ